MNTLCLHTGGKEVSREELIATATPEATKTWHPIPHNRILELTEQNLGGLGYTITKTQYAIHKDGNRFFGLMWLKNGTNYSDYSLMVGLRNSHDKSFPSAIALGSSVFVCDNLAFSGEVKLARRHTINIERDLPNVVQRALGRLSDLRVNQDTRIEAYKKFDVSDLQAHDLIVRALDTRVINTCRLPKVLAEYRTPKHPEFKPRNAWSLFNSFTEVFKETPIDELPSRSQALHGLMDQLCGLHLKPVEGEEVNN